MSETEVKPKPKKKNKTHFKDITKSVDDTPRLKDGRVWYADAIDRKKYVTGKTPINARAVALIISHYLGQNADQVEETSVSRTAPMLDVALCAIIMKAAKDGDQSKLEFLLNRVIGKVADRIETITFDERALQKLDAVPTSQLLDAIVQAQVIDDETEDKEPEYLGANNNK